MSQESSSSLIIEGNNKNHVLTWYENCLDCPLDITKYNKYIAEVSFVQNSGQQLFRHNTSYHQSLKQTIIQKGAICLFQAKKPFALPRDFNSLYTPEDIKIRCESSSGKTIIKYPFKTSTQITSYDQIIKVEQINESKHCLTETSILSFNSYYLVTFTETFDIINPKFLNNIKWQNSRSTKIVNQKYDYISKGPSTFSDQNIGIVGFLNDEFSFNNCEIKKDSTPKQMKIYLKNQLRMHISFYSERLGTKFSYTTPLALQKTYENVFVDGDVYFD